MSNGKGSKKTAPVKVVRVPCMRAANSTDPSLTRPISAPIARANHYSVGHICDEKCQRKCR